MGAGSWGARVCGAWEPLNKCEVRGRDARAINKCGINLGAGARVCGEWELLNKCGTGATDAPPRDILATRW